MHPNATIQPAAARPRALLLCYHFFPSAEVASRRVGAFARTLRSGGYDVVVTSAFGNAPEGRIPDQASGFDVLYVPGPPPLLTGWLVALKRLVRKKSARVHPDTTTGALSPAPPPAPVSTMTVADRVRDHLFALFNIIDTEKKWAFLTCRAVSALAKQKPLHVVISSGPPHSGQIAAHHIARRLGIPLILDFRDPLFAGENDTAETGYFTRLILRFFEKRIIAAAAAILTTTTGITNALRDRYPPAAARIHTVLNGFDGEPSQRNPDTGHRLNILFAGALYMRRDPFPFLTALEHLLTTDQIDPDKVSVTFIGDCEAFSGIRLADWLVGKRCAGAVSVLPAAPPAEIEALIGQATVLLNLAQGQQRQIPAKTFEHLASGRELLAICEADSDTGRLLDSIPGVIRLTPGDQTALDAALVDLYQRHVVEGQLRQLAPEDVFRYSRTGQNEAFRRIVEDVAGRPVDC